MLPPNLLERSSLRGEPGLTAVATSSLSTDDLYLDKAALNLHAFYSGVERLFELIAFRHPVRSPRFVCFRTANA